MMGGESQRCIGEHCPPIKQLMVVAYRLLSSNGTTEVPVEIPEPIMGYQQFTAILLCIPPTVSYHLIVFFFQYSFLSHIPLMDIDPLANLRQAYVELERRVQRALNTQVGDDERLAEVQQEVLSYIQAVEQVCRVCLLLLENTNNINLGV
jgi:hypothetical protein